MPLALAIALIILSIFAHEFGHAMAMSRRGITIESLGLGLPIKKLPTLRIVHPWFSFPILIHLLPGIGYVKPSESASDDIARLPIREQSVIHGAGILMNLCFTLALLGWVTPFWYGWSITTIFTILVFTLAALFLLAIRRFLCRFVIPLVGVVNFFLVIFAVIQKPLSTISGPVGIVAEATHRVIGYDSAILFAAVLSLAIGVTNTLPILPLDGGRYVLSYLRGLRTKGWERGYYVFSVASLALLLVLVILSDGSRFLH